MANIFARSPYIIEIDESSVVGSKVELFFYYTGSAPANPQYTLTKKVPSSTNLKMYYDVSPYCRDYIEFTTRQTAIGTLPTTSGAKSLISFTVHKVGAAGSELLSGASVSFSWG